jgi:hypothetical protein
MTRFGYVIILPIVVKSFIFSGCVPKTAAEIAEEKRLEIVEQKWDACIDAAFNVFEKREEDCIEADARENCFNIAELNYEKDSAECDLKFPW